MFKFQSITMNKNLLLGVGNLSIHCPYICINKLFQFKEMIILAMQIVFQSVHILITFRRGIINWVTLKSLIIIISLEKFPFLIFVRIFRLFLIIALIGMK